jgi:uncharacterized protein (DUF608 family)
LLYSLSEEEKKVKFNLTSEFREQGYIVDLNETTMNQLKEFKLSYNRHNGKYDTERPNYNYALYNTKYYYADQNLSIFKGE